MLQDLLGENFRRQMLMDGQYGSITFICTKTDVIQVKNKTVLSLCLPANITRCVTTTTSGFLFANELLVSAQSIQHCLYKCLILILCW